MTDELLPLVKALLRIEGDDEDALLTLHLEIAIDRILAYCNLEKLPDGLRLVAVQMAAELYNEATVETAGGVASVSEAGRTVQFDASTAQAAAEDKIKARRVQLNRFRRLYRCEGCSDGL